MARTKDVWEHDCMNPDCYHDWDVRGKQVDTCPKCKGTDIVVRPRPMVSMQNLMTQTKEAEEDRYEGTLHEVRLPGAVSDFWFGGLFRG